MKLISIAIIFIYAVGVESVQEDSSGYETNVKTEALNCPHTSDTCEQETFEVQCMGKGNVTVPCTNSWPPATGGENIKPKEFCLLPTGLPLMRRCNYNESNCTVQWQDMDFKKVKCLSDVKQNIITNDLLQMFEVLKGSMEIDDDYRVNVTGELVQLLAKREALRVPADFELTADILKLITQNARNHSLVPKVLQIMNLLMKSNDNVIRSSQKLGTINRLLKITEDFYDDMISVMYDCIENTNGYRHYLGNLMSIFYINPACTSKSGIAVYSGSSKALSPPFYAVSTNVYIRYLEEDWEGVFSEPHLKAAVIFTPDLRLQVKKFEGRDKILRISMYKKSRLFVNANFSKFIPDCIVFRISSPGFSDNQKYPLAELLLTSQKKSTFPAKCSYWDYRRWHLDINDWEMDNKTKCTSYYLPSFISMITVRRNASQSIDVLPLLTTSDEDDIDVNSIVACILSLFGLLCIFITSLIFKEWRLQFSNKLLLNICLVLTLLMIYFLVINVPSLREAVQDLDNLHRCKIMGVLLHYSILVFMLWMLFVAVLQYYRYASVFGSQPHKRFVMRCAMAAWVLPLIATGLVLYLDSQSYTSFVERGIDKHVLCCPAGLSWYLAVLLPFCLVLCADFCIFVYIICQINSSLSRFHQTQEREDVIRQGVFLFVYFVIFDKIARDSWLAYIFHCCRSNRNSMERISFPQRGDDIIMKNAM
ncbi:uncharacterized protein LOC106081956 [Stomoxys calcitrans]|uniref:uncharacterized protein LOC106081956 n=1 Tax=Stomoxys calcitrans TaxID=35570 RepID=UPI0027E3AACF|nr:uncharacterized protein LOC106081956 [Stomoxys calcitrans]